MAGSGDEDVVEVFAGQSADPAFAFARGARAGVRVVQISAPANAASQAR
jgi:hypothetical protein